MAMFFNHRNSCFLRLMITLVILTAAFSALSLSAYAGTVTPVITVEPERSIEMSCTDSVNIPFAASGSNKYEWQIYTMGRYFSVSDMTAALPDLASSLKNYNTSSLRISGGKGLVHEPGGSVIFRCKVIPVVSTGDTAVAAYTVPVSVSINHNWVYTYKNAEQHGMICADCGSSSVGEHHFKWVVTEQPSYSAGTAYKECVHCDYKSSELSVKTEFGTNIGIIFDSNGGTNDLIKNGSSTYGCLAAKNTFKCDIDPKYMHKDGHSFRGWALCSDAVDPIYLPGEKILYSETMTLYAVWGEKLFGYSTLSDAGKVLYNTVDQAVRNMKTESCQIPIDGQVKEDYFITVLSIYVNDHPENFWFLGVANYSRNASNTVTAFTPMYTINNTGASSTAIVSARGQLYEKLYAVMAELDAENLHDDGDIALWLHDKVAEIITYKNTVNDQTAYGGLVEGEAVCAGYARLYQLLLNLSGIRAFTVTGSSVNPSTGIGEPHAWTLMWLDGDCVYTDVTWDDRVTDVYHVYFARSYSQISIDHQAQAGHIVNSIPKCTSCDDHGYFTVVSPENDLTSSGASIEKLNTLAEVSDNGLGTIVRRFVIFSKKDNIVPWINENLNSLCASYGYGSFSMQCVGLGKVGDLGMELHLVITQEGAPVLGATVSGSVVSFNDATDTITVSLWKGNSKVYETTAKGNSASYSISGVSAGSYTMKVSKSDHVTREYTVTVGSSNVTLDVKIHLKGDINGDGKVNTTDVGRANAHAKKTSLLTDYALACADVSGDGRVNTTDVGRMNAHAKKTNLLW